jgi:hypothetical protein
MSAKISYDLWASGTLRAKYRTLGQALLGALWRSKKLTRYVYVYKTDGQTRSVCIAAVTASDTFLKF